MGGGPGESSDHEENARVRGDCFWKHMSITQSRESGESRITSATFSSDSYGNNNSSKE